MKRNLSTTHIIFIISLFLILLFILPVAAVEKWRESNLEGGWQIWIEAADFDRRDDTKIIKTGKEEQKLAAKAQKPWLGEEIIVAPVLGGFMEYDFKSSLAGKAHIYCRVMDFRGGGQSWFIVLNSLNHEGEGLIMDTKANWVWAKGRDKPDSLSPTELKNGKNTIRVVPREAGAGVESLMDVFVVSTKPFNPKDDDFNKAKQRSEKAVQPEGKLATMWSTIKSNLPFQE